MDPYLIALGVLFCVAAGLVVYALVPRGQKSDGAIKRRLEGRRGVDEDDEIRERARTTATETVVRKAAPMLSRLVMPASDAEQTQLRAKLATAGFRQPQAQTIFMASKSIAAVGCTLLAVVIGISTHLEWQMLVGAAAQIGRAHV